MVDQTHLWPLVSVVVPVFNGERYLRQSLDSILAQTYPRLELLVMDDASTDGTAGIISSYKDRVTPYRQPHNRGQFANVNDGVMRAQGEYIAVYHSDDVYAPTIVEREVTFLQEHPEAGAVFCLALFIDALGRECGSLQVPAEVRGSGPFDYKTILNALLLHKNSFICGPSSMVRASVYQDVGLYRGDEFGIASDLEMWVRIAERRPVGILEEQLFGYRFGHGNLSENYYRHRTELERHFLIMDQCLTRGGKNYASPEALAALEAHRAEDCLMVAANNYILGRRAECREILGQVKATGILASSKVQACRLLILFLTMKILVRLPRIRFVADLFHRRWHVNKYAKLTPELRPLLEIK
jgi:glycosyltransferase involved in cell wall biosynthesis